MAWHLTLVPLLALLVWDGRRPSLRKALRVFPPVAVAIWATSQSAWWVVPLLAACAVSVAYFCGRWADVVPAKYWLVAIGFSVSWFADAVAALTGGSWAAVHFYPSIQIGLWAYAYGSLLVPAMAFAVPLLGWYESPDLVVTAVGTAVVCWLAIGDDLMGVMLLVGLTAVFYLLLVGLRHDREAFDAIWVPYQSFRLLSFALFSRVVYARGSP